MNDMINCMKYLWERIERKNWSESAKYKCLLCLLSAVFGASGLLAWLAVRSWICGTIGGMLCFIGCPMVVSWFVAFLYTCNHSFHNGSGPAV